MTIFEPGETAPRILIADDDPSILRLLAGRCSLMGFEVETAFNGTQALRRVRQGGVDTLIIDVQMPELDGLSVSAYLLEYSTRPLHVIVATGRRDAETVGTCDSMGALHVHKDASFWENLESALVEIYPANADRIRQSGLRSTKIAVPERSQVVLSGRKHWAANKLSLKREIGGRPGAAQIVRKSIDSSELFGTLQKFCGFGINLI